MTNGPITFIRTHRSGRAILRTWRKVVVLTLFFSLVQVLHCDVVGEKTKRICWQRADYGWRETTIEPAIPVCLYDPLRHIGQAFVLIGEVGLVT